MDYPKRTWAIIKLDHLEHNVNTIRNLLKPSCMIMGVVKADAYGHGEQYVAQQLAKCGVNWFGVSNIDEALSLRRYGHSHPILIFGYTPVEYVTYLAEYQLTQTVFSYEYAWQLQEAATACGQPVDIHIKIDTGMGRLGWQIPSGFLPRSIDEITCVCSMDHLHATGVFTHFAVADEGTADSINYTKMQYQTFQNTIDQLEQRGVCFSIRHCCNSAATVRYPQMHMDMVRPGIILYGLSPSSDCVGMIDLHPVMELYSRIAMIKEVPAGTSLSYGRTFTAPTVMRVATVPIGYADGYGRELSNKARMLVRGQYANVIGRVCMDQLLLDVTKIEAAALGDRVTVIGQDGSNGLTLDEMAQLSGTINYEKACLLGKRVPRVYYKEEKEIACSYYYKQSDSIPEKH